MANLGIQQEQKTKPAPQTAGDATTYAASPGRRTKILRVFNYTFVMVFASIHSRDKNIRTAESIVVWTGARSSVIALYVLIDI